MDLLVPQENRFVCYYTVTGVLAKGVHTVDSFHWVCSVWLKPVIL